MQLYADILFTDGRIYTADPARPWVEAVTVRDRPSFLGRAAELAELRGPRTEVVSIGAGLLLPGFTESHIHLVETALRAAEIDVTGIAMPDANRAALSDAP